MEDPRELKLSSTECETLRAAMQGVFDRMKLVSREELEVQEQVLQRY